MSKRTAATGGQKRSFDADPTVTKSLCLATPLIILLMLLLQNKPSVMGAYTSGRAMNITMVLIFLFSILMAITGIVGLQDLL